jgi:hypothetical protein
VKEITQPLSVSNDKLTPLSPDDLVELDISTIPPHNTNSVPLTHAYIKALGDKDIADARGWTILHQLWEEWVELLKTQSKTLLFDDVALEHNAGMSPRNTRRAGYFASQYEKMNRLMYFLKAIGFTARILRVLGINWGFVSKSSGVTNDSRNDAAEILGGLGETPVDDWLAGFRGRYGIQG